MMLHLLPSILARRKIPAPSSRKFISKQKVFSFGKGQFCVFPETEPLNTFQEDEQRDSAAGGVLTFMVTSCVDPRTDELSSIRSEKPHSVSRDLPGEKWEICKKKKKKRAKVLKNLWKQFTADFIHSSVFPPSNPIQCFPFSSRLKLNMFCFIISVLNLNIDHVVLFAKWKRRHSNGQ